MTGFGNWVEGERQRQRFSYGITMAPRREIAKPVAPFPFNCGTKRP